MNFPSFFSSVFGRDCSEIETDPKADPFDKEICHSFRQFEESFNDVFTMPEIEQQDDQEEAPPTDPQSLRDSILSRQSTDDDETPPTTAVPPRPLYRGHRPQTKRFHKDLDDRDLDSEYDENPDAFNEIFSDESHDGKRSLDKPRPFFHSSHSSVSIKTIRRPDGSIEQYKTVRDSSGHEETTVTHTGPEDEIDDSEAPLDRLYNWLWPK